MIHSLAGGVIKGETFNDYAKVKLFDGENAGKTFWYLSDLDLDVGDKVVVQDSNGFAKLNGEVLRVDKHVSSFVAPIQKSKIRKIIRKIIWKYAKKCQNMQKFTFFCNIFKNKGVIWKNWK